MELNGKLKKLGDKAKAVTAILVLTGMVVSGAAWGVERYVRSIVEQVVIDAMNEFRTEWRCSEWNDELERRLLDIMLGDDSVETAVRVERLRELIRTNNCARFDT